MPRNKTVDENGLPIEKRGRSGMLIAGGLVFAAIAAAALGAATYFPKTVETAEAKAPPVAADPVAAAIEADTSAEEATAQPAPDTSTVTGAAEPAKSDETLVAQAAQKGDAVTTPTKTTTTTSTYGGWTVQCQESGETKVCSATFRVFNKENNANILVWAFGFNTEGKFLAELNTLTDILIEPGVVLTLDEGKPIKVNYVECSTRGCKARLEMTPNLVRQMKAAKKAKIDMTRLDGQVIQFAMEIPGIDQALADLGV